MKHIKIYLPVIILILSFKSIICQEWNGLVELSKTYTVESGEILSIYPGTTVRLAPDASLIIRGTLLAEGTETANIRFTSLEPESSGKDYWRGMIFEGANKDTSRLSYCEIENIITADQIGSIHLITSNVNFKNCHIHDNEGYAGGGINCDASNLTLLYNNIENNTAALSGGGLHVTSSYAQESVFYGLKNIIKGNKVTSIENRFQGGGGIYISEKYNYPYIITLQENDIVANTTENLDNPAGAGGGVLIQTMDRFRIDFIGNKVMYNTSYYGGGMKIHHNADKLSPFTFKNNIISNNSSSDIAGGINYDLGNLRDVSGIIFENNNILNNLNIMGKTGAGGIYISNEAGVFFRISSCIIYNNKLGANSSDISSYPSTYPGEFTFYTNTTSLIEGEGNSAYLPQFYRDVNYAGAEPYENYLRADHHLSLESDLVDAGDPKIESVEPDGTTVNMGAWGNTAEATTSKYDTYMYLGEPPSVLQVKTGQVMKVDCREWSKMVNFNDIVVEDGGQIFIADDNSRDIYVNYLEVQGKKIGDQYTTRFQKMTTKNQELTYNILHINNINCTGAEFNNMAVDINTSNPSKLNDSRVYVFDYNAELPGVNINSPDVEINNTTVDNFGKGIYVNGGSLKAQQRRCRLSNNTVTFDADVASKETSAKGIMAENMDDATIENNEIVNPNEGIECKASSGRISNNSVTFDADVASKAGTVKKGIYIYGGGSYQIDHNSIASNDDVTPSMSGIEVLDSYVNVNYNIISFGSYDPKSCNRYSFYTTNLSEGSIFINNTVDNSNFGIEDHYSYTNIRIINNIFFGRASSYITGTEKNLLLYNNNISGEINYSAVADEKNNIASDPVFQSTTVSDYYLYRTSPSINTGLYVPEYHEYGVTYYGSAPDMGAMEYYEESVLNAPSNLTISVGSTTVILNWDPVEHASSYLIYKSTDPYSSSYEYVKSTANTYYSLSNEGLSKYFYYIVASTSAAKDEVVHADSDHSDENKKIKFIDKKVKKSFK